jgi:hypothetical protein
MTRISQLVFIAGLVAVSNIAWADSFSAGAWQGYGTSCSAYRSYAQPRSEVSLGIYADDDHSVHIKASIVRKDGVAYRPAIAVKLDGTPVAQVRSEEGVTPDTLLIDMGPEIRVRSLLEHASLLSIDTGAEVLSYSLSNMSLLVAKLDGCMKHTISKIPSEPGPGAVAVYSPATPAPTLAQRCDGYTDFVIYHGSWEHEPSPHDRAQLHEYTQYVTQCVALWKQRCKPLELFPTGNTYAFCEIRADAAEAHLNNRRTFERRAETFRQYNSRAAEIDHIFTQASDSFFASAQKPIDDYKEVRRQEQEAQDRQAAARREEELIAVLRQLANQNAAEAARGPVMTNCVGSDGNVQCTTY